LPLHHDSKSKTLLNCPLLSRLSYSGNFPKGGLEPPTYRLPIVIVAVSVFNKVCFCSYLKEPILPTGLEPVRLSALHSKCNVSSIPPQEHMEPEGRNLTSLAFLGCHYALRHIIMVGKEGFEPPVYLTCRIY